MKNVVFCIYAISLAIWFCFGIASFMLAPSGINDDGYYSDPLDAPTIEEMSQAAPEFIKPYVFIYEPLVWMIEPTKEGRYELDGLVAAVGGIFILLCLIAAILYFGKNDPKLERFTLGQKILSIPMVVFFLYLAVGSYLMLIC